jgi:hypothetical protein
MIRAQRSLHRYAWFILVPLLGFLVWLSVTHRDTTLPNQLAPHVTKEARLP